MSKSVLNNVFLKLLKRKKINANLSAAERAKREFEDSKSAFEQEKAQFEHEN